MKMTRIVWPLAVAVGFALSACGTVDPGSGEAGGMPNDDDDDGDDTTAGPVDPSAEDTGPVDPSDTDDDDPSDDEGDEDGCNFLCPPDGGTPGTHECDMFAQDCPAGDKCMPWANDGGNAWNATMCTPIDDNPAEPGDECMVEGSGVSGIDNCALGSMCWDVDSETNMGVCAPMCTGSADSPLCDDPDTTCINVNDGAIVLCLATCDPLLQDCGDGSACYGVQDSFTCVPDASGPSGLFGDPCEYINACDPGLFCANADAVPGCQGSQGCCSEFCDLDEPNCAGQDQECVAWSEDPQPGMEGVGACAIPI